MMIENTEKFDIEDNELDIKERTWKIPKAGINQFLFFNLLASTRM